MLESQGQDRLKSFEGDEETLGGSVVSEVSWKDKQVAHEPLKKDPKQKIRLWNSQSFVFIPFFSMAQEQTGGTLNSNSLEGKRGDSNLCAHAMTKTGRTLITQLWVPFCLFFY